MKRITELNYTEAKAFFLKKDSYFRFDLPQYFAFQNILDEIAKTLDGKERFALFRGKFCQNSPCRQSTKHWNVW